MNTVNRTYHFTEFAKLLWKHRLWSLGSRLGLGMPEDLGTSQRSSESNASVSTDAESLNSLILDIEALGPIYIKLAQIASTRRDIVPSKYCDAFRKLQDNVAAEPSPQIIEVIERELGVAVNRAFATFDPVPIACASIAQVHRATMRDGREVVVKVQRPGIVEKAIEQVKALQELSSMADRNLEIGRAMRFRSLIDAVAFVFESEIDYRIEARNLKELKTNLAEFRYLEIPQVVEDFVRQRVLVMEFIGGAAIDQLSGVVLNEINTKELALEFVNAYLKQTLIDGLFHADPHPGNLVVTREGNLALLDGGMVVRLSPQQRNQLGMLMLAVSDGAGEDVANTATEIGQVEEHFNIVSFRHEIGQVIAQTRLGQGKGTSCGQALIRLLTVSGKHGLVMPAEMVMFTKALLQSEETLQLLHPELHLGQLVREFCPQIIQAKTAEYLNLARATQKAMDFADLTSDLPKRLNKITQHLADNSFRVQVDSVGQQKLLAGLEKVANRITAGLVSAALILAAAILLQTNGVINTKTGLIVATLFFALAAIVGLYLIYRSWRSDSEAGTK